MNTSASVPGGGIATNNDLIQVSNQGNSRPLYLSDFYSWCRYCSPVWHSCSFLLHIVCLVATCTFFYIQTFLLSESIWCHWNHSMCLLCCLTTSVLFQITNEVPPKFFFLPSSLLSIYHQSTIITWILLDVFCSHWDFCALPHHLNDLDSHQSLSLLLSTIAHLNLFPSSPKFYRLLVNTSHTPDDTVLVCDLGTSAGLTPFKSDFFEYVKCSIPVHDISKVYEVIEIVTTIHKFVDTKGRFFYLPQVAYHLPSSEVCLFSPQVFHQNCGGKSIIFGDRVEIHLTNWHWHTHWCIWV